MADYKAASMPLLLHYCCCHAMRAKDDADAVTRCRAPRAFIIADYAAADVARCLRRD